MFNTIQRLIRSLRGGVLHPRRIVREQIQIADNIRVRVHDIEDLREATPNWDDLDERGRLAVTRRVAPVHEQSTRNTTTAGLHEYHVENLSPKVSTDLTTSHLAVGTDSTSPSSGNTALNNEVYRVGISDSSVKGNELYTSTFLDTSEATGQTLREAGLFTASSGGSLLNHSTIDPVDKTADNTATIDASLIWSTP